MIMNESGFFWLSNLSEGELAVPGQLTIDDKGFIELELHQSFAGRLGAEAIFGAVGIDKGIYILGILKKIREIHYFKKHQNQWGTSWTYFI